MVCDSDALSSVIEWCLLLQLCGQFPGVLMPQQAEHCTAKLQLAAVATSLRAHLTLLLEEPNQETLQF